MREPHGPLIHDYIKPVMVVGNPDIDDIKSAVAVDHWGNGLYAESRSIARPATTTGIGFWELGMAYLFVCPDGDWRASGDLEFYVVDSRNPCRA